MSYHLIRLPLVPRDVEKISTHSLAEHEALMLAGVEFEPEDLVCVEPSSPMRLRKAVETMARYFRREFEYDFVQYEARDPGASSERAYLWTSAARHPVFIGAASFRWREWKDAAPGFALQWIWLHPYERRRGHLTRAWPFFRARFGEFFTEGPVSSAMAGFLVKHGEWPQAFPSKSAEHEAALAEARRWFDRRGCA